jgi:hypothetical protein
MSLRALGAGALIAALSFAAAGAPGTRSYFTDSPAVGSNAFATSQLQPPTGLSATPGCQVLAPKITLDWTATTSAFGDGYDVYRGTASGGPYTSIGHVTGRTTTTYTDASGLSLNTTYYYVLRSTAYAWRSGTSNQASAKTPLLCLF